MFHKKLFCFKNHKLEKQNTIKKIALFSFLSAGIGAILSLLFAPKKGSELRKDIADKSKEIGNKITQKTQELKDQAKQKFSDIEKGIAEKLQSNKEEDKK